jgi:hypothetical protein
MGRRRRYACHILVGKVKHKGRTAVWIPRCRWEENIVV